MAILIERIEPFLRRHSFQTDVEIWQNVAGKLIVELHC